MKTTGSQSSQIVGEVKVKIKIEQRWQVEINSGV